MITHEQKAVNTQSEISLNFKLQEEFHLGAEKFANNPLHQKLRQDSDIRKQLDFVPNMLYFVMGFKDLMQLVRYENPANDLEESVNTHSDEDSNHWEWYLQDLAFMSGQFKNASSVDLIASVWADETMEVRETIYTFSRYIKQYKDPVARMLMIEVLEITFDKFKEAIHPALKKADLYSQLDYFGKMHQETEENHSTGISDDEIAELTMLLPEELKEEMIPIVNELFDQMYNMAKNWSEA
ncbi:hypothetical protein [Ekhidna sp. To15]|uniref:hypothetical protein n=1 Tax=Ekhidna sp. To15 TaxID=3395267 RepID=UPI003F5282ED